MTLLYFAAVHARYGSGRITSWRACSRKGVAAATLERLGLTAEAIRDSGRHLFGPPLPATNRLDRAQAAIWSSVLAGDYLAVMVFLQISQRRGKPNGLDSPPSVATSPNVRGEMDRAVFELRRLFEVTEAQWVTDDRSD